MKEQLITFETAKIAKEKGFFNLKSGDTSTINILDNFPTDFGVWKQLLPIPSQSILNQWIREKLKIHIIVERNASGWYWAMCQTDGGTNLGYSDYSGPNLGGVWDKYEDAFENGLIVAMSLKLNPA